MAARREMRRPASLSQAGQARGCVVRWISTSRDSSSGVFNPPLTSAGAQTGNTLHRDQRFEFQSRGMLAAIADRDVDAGSIEVGILMRGLDAQRQLPDCAA